MTARAGRNLRHSAPPPRRRAALLAALVMTLAACGFIGGDDSGIGGFDRITTAQVAMLGSIDGDGTLTILEQQPVNGIVGDPTRPPAGPVQHLRDPFDYRLEHDRVYLMLLAPTVEAQQDTDLGSGQYTVLYLHDPDTDLPAGRFPDREIQPDQRPEDYLDCIRADFDAPTRFDGLVAAVDAGGDPLWDCI